MDTPNSPNGSTVNLGTGDLSTPRPPERDLCGYAGGGSDAA